MKRIGHDYASFIKLFPALYQAAISFRQNIANNPKISHYKKPQNLSQKFSLRILFALFYLQNSVYISIATFWEKLVSYYHYKGVPEFSSVFIFQFVFSFYVPCVLNFLNKVMLFHMFFPICFHYVIRAIYFSTCA